MFCAQDTTNCCLHKVPVVLIRSCKVAVNDHQINPESSRPLSARRDTWRHGSARAAAALHASTRVQAGLRPPPLWRTNLLENIPTHLPTTQGNVNNKYLFLLVFLYVFAKISVIILCKNWWQFESTRWWLSQLIYSLVQPLGRITKHTAPLCFVHYWISLNVNIVVNLLFTD